MLYQSFDNVGGIKDINFGDVGPQPPSTFILFRLLYSPCCSFAKLLYFFLLFLGALLLPSAQVPTFRSSMRILRLMGSPARESAIVRCNLSNPVVPSTMPPSPLVLSLVQ